MRCLSTGALPSFLIRLLFAAAVTATLTGGAGASQFKRIRDISVTCTDALTCDVSAYNAQSELYTVTFRRSAARDAPLVLVLGVRETLAAGSEVVMAIDGVEVVRLPVSRLSYRAAVYEYIFKGEAEIAALADAARAGQELRVTFRARGADTVATFPLSGFVAGLTFMDEIQGRSGREDALQATGDVETPTTGKMRRIASLDDIPFQLRADFANTGSAMCGGMGEKDFAALDGFEADTGDGVSLIGLPCGPGEAGNQPYAFWERRGSLFRQAALPVMTPEGPSVTDAAWNAAWNQERMELTAVSGGRGGGDCGAFNRWGWRVTDGGGAFVLLEARVRSDCQGDAAGDPENWPQVWPPD